MFLDTDMFKGVSVEIDPRLPVSAGEAPCLGRNHGALYEYWADKESKQVFAYTETVGFTTKMYCSKEHFERLHNLPRKGELS